MTARAWLVVGIVSVPLLVYPIVSAVGGTPRFPTRAECVRPAVEGQQVDVVWGRSSALTEAEALRGRVVAVGFVGTDVLPDGCGRWKVVLESLPNIEIAREVVKEAETVDLHPTLELDSDG